MKTIFTNTDKIIEEVTRGAEMLKWVGKDEGWTVFTLPPVDADYTKIILKDDISVIKIMTEKDGYLMLRRSGRFPFIVFKKDLFNKRFTHWKFNKN